MLWIVNRLFWQVSNNETQGLAIHLKLIKQNRKKGKFSDPTQAAAALGNPFHLLSHQQNQCIC